MLPADWGMQEHILSSVGLKKTDSNSCHPFRLSSFHSTCRRKLVIFRACPKFASYICFSWLYANECHLVLGPCGAEPTKLNLLQCTWRVSTWSSTNEHVDFPCKLSLWNVVWTLDSVAQKRDLWTWVLWKRIHLLLLDHGRLVSSIYGQMWSSVNVEFKPALASRGTVQIKSQTLQSLIRCGFSCFHFVIFITFQLRRDCQFTSQ